MSKRNLIWLAVILVVCLVFYRLAPMAAQQDSVYRTYAPLVEADALIRQKFVETIDDDRLVDGAVRGMMLKLDPYSGYVSPDELAAFRRNAAGEYIGIGVQLGVRDGQLTVIAPIELSPAVKAGVLAGDVIQAIDGVSTEGMSVVDVDQLLSGRVGSTVALTVRRAATAEVETLSITRGPVDIRSVKGFSHNEAGGWDYWIDPQARIAYVRVANFHEDTIAEFDRTLDRLRSAAVAGLILDLRFNPGGSLWAAVAMVDRFIKRGVIVSTVTRHKAVDRYEARPEHTFPRIPMAVLVNDHSASASEIVAGSLQDHGRAVIVGTRSFGKGVVQNVIELSEHRAALKLTVAHYRLPNGRIIHKTARNANTDGWGVMPDVVVDLPRDQVNAIPQRWAEVDRAMTTSTTAPAGSGQFAAAPASVDRMVDIDPQLEAALAAVRGQIERERNLEAVQETTPR
jgi:carboxyl-terminal processing protease